MNILINAAKNGNFKKVQELLTKPFNVNAKDNNGNTALHWAAQNGHKEIVQALLDWAAELDAKNQFGDTALILAASKGEKETVKALLDGGANLNAQSKNGNTALIWATQNGHKEIVTALLNRGADINAKNKDGDTALILAASKGDKEIVQVLLDGGANLNAQSKNGYTALLWAAHNGRTEIVKALLDKGAEVNAKDCFDGETALHCAAKNGHLETVQALLDGGADVNAKNRYGKTALSWAIRYGHKEIAHLLRLHKKYQKICLSLAKKSPLENEEQPGSPTTFKDFSFAQNLNHGAGLLDEFLKTQAELLDKDQKTESVEDKIKAYGQIKWKTSFFYKVLRVMSFLVRALFQLLRGKQQFSREKAGKVASASLPPSAPAEEDLPPSYEEAVRKKHRSSFQQGEQGEPDRPPAYNSGYKNNKD